MILGRATWLPRVMGRRRLSARPRRFFGTPAMSGISAASVISPAKFQGPFFNPDQEVPMTNRQPAGDPQNSTRYKRARQAFFKAHGSVGTCSICGKPVDMGLSGRGRWGRSIDHRVPTSAGGSFFDVSNWQLAHRGCNSAKGRGAPVDIEPRSPFR